MTTDKLMRNIYNVDVHQSNESHVLLIGYNEEPTQQVYFIDPNYPDFISSIHFDLFKENLHVPEYVHVHKKTIQPDDVIYINTNCDSNLKRRKI